MDEFSGITVNNLEKDRVLIGLRRLILADRPFILPSLGFCFRNTKKDITLINVDDPGIHQDFDT